MARAERPYAIAKIWGKSDVCGSIVKPVDNVHEKLAHVVEIHMYEFVESKAFAFGSLQVHLSRVVGKPPRSTWASQLVCSSARLHSSSYQRNSGTHG